jgi:putative ABC transport system permease protein
MVRNYLIVAWRSLMRTKGNTFLKIGGLAIAMAVAMLIGLWIYNELSFNKYFANYDRLARVMRLETWHNLTSAEVIQPTPLAEELRSSYKSDFTSVVMSSQTREHVLSISDRKFAEMGNYMESDGPAMLSLKMVYGGYNQPDNPNSIMLKESLARRLFGNTDPTDKLLKLDDTISVKVAGVYEDLPDNCDFKNVSFIAPWELFVATNDWVSKFAQSWGSASIQVFTLLKPVADVQKVSAKIRNIKRRHVTGSDAAANPVVFLNPMNKWHMYSKFVNGVRVTSDAEKFVWFYGIIGVFVLLLGCINFMNLSTARAVKRSKEVGIRKVLGSLRRQLAYQFFSESIIVALLAFVCSILLVLLILPWFNTIVGNKVGILWANPWFWLAGIVFAIFTGILAGIYPALYLSSFNPVKALKGTIQVGRNASIPRKVMVVVQFSVSIALIIGTIIVFRQIQFAKDRPVGYSREGLVMLHLVSQDLKDKYEAIRSELAKSNVVVETAESASPMTNISASTGSSNFKWQGADPVMSTDFGIVPVTFEYGKAIGWQFVEGRDFSREFGSDSSAFILNEAAVKYMGLKHPLGEEIDWENPIYNSSETPKKIIGVVKDMVMRSPFESAYPTIFFLGGGMNWMFIRVNPNVSAREALSKIEAVLKGFAPSAPFDYKFVDEEYAAKFASEERTGKLTGFFAILSIFISCIGLFGMASFIAEQRIKEIGVRKVLGASVQNIWGLLSKEFAMLVLISMVIAIPVSGLFMYNWLQNYQYRTSIAWWIFALAGLIALLIALLSVSYHTIRAALTNPVNNLKAE